MALKLSNNTSADLTSFFCVSHFIHPFSITFTTILGGNFCSWEQCNGILLIVYRIFKKHTFWFGLGFFFNVSLVYLPFLLFKGLHLIRCLASVNIFNSKQLFLFVFWFVCGVLFLWFRFLWKDTSMKHHWFIILLGQLLECCCSQTVYYSCFYSNK